MTEKALTPLDEHNQRLQQNVHPETWQNPTPCGRYNLVVIGAGTAGLVTASAAAGLGAKVALIERSLMGGDCLNVGCVPSKGLLSASKRAAALQGMNEFGIEVPEGVHVDFSKIMTRMRKLRADISPVDSAQRYKELGVDVYFGNARFIDASHIDVNGVTLEFSKASICTGARAAAPDIPGLEQVSYLTNETIFSLTERPKRLGIVGAGPIGCEMAQAFARLGTEVTLLASSKGILPREDPDAVAVLESSLKKDGVSISTEGKELRIEKTEQAIKLRLPSGDLEVDQLLIAVGRKANVEGLDLEKAGVIYSDKGVQVNEYLQTTHKNIYAAGDVCTDKQFTHAADFMARNVIQNALFFGRSKMSSLLIPWSTYCEPELAQVGITSQQAHIQNIEIDTFIQEFEHVDRALLEGEGEGFVKVHVKKGSDRILGVTIVGKDAGDLISFYTLAMNNKIGLKKLAGSIYPYPSRAEIVRKTGDAYNRTRLTPKVKAMMEKFLAWRR
ncbi:mercuric reductase [Kiritimatiellota bacterium B12222]|nr:mercuric reductase [Kiritimatiellota bacterium B12222]